MKFWNFFLINLFAILCKPDSFEIQLNSQQSSNQLLSKNKTKEYHQVFLNKLSYSQYVGNLELGTPKQKFSVVFDTGSSWITIPISSCNNCAKPLFNCLSSKTCKINKNEIEVSYGNFDIKGYLGNETFSISNLQVSNQSAIFVEKITKGKMNENGICGLGFSSNSFGHQNIIENLYQQKKIDKKLFSFYINKDTPEGSLLLIGDYNPSFAKTPIKYFKVISNKHWILQMDNFLINNTTYEIPEKNSLTKYKKVLIDSGSNVLVVPKSFAKNFIIILHKKYKKICTIDDNMIECACPRGINLFPNLVFTFESIEKKIENYTIAPENYILNRKNVCYLKIAHIDDKNFHMWILGHPFFFSTYTVFDFENKMIGISVVQEKITKNIFGILSLRWENAFIIFSLIIVAILIGLVFIWGIKKASGLENLNEKDGTEYFT